ncbi:ribonuclease-III-like-domain-containing protein [Sporodiniella umbellata]|nr:ribonuclease-III-like-domain-containing protein [Sporodiniella umbellata]
MLQNVHMTVRSCSRRSFHTSRSLSIQKTSSNIQAAAKEFKLSPNALSQALTHKSFKHGNAPNNERLQLLGRRSLEYFVIDANIGKNAETLLSIIKQYSATEHLSARFDALGLEKNIQYELPTRKTANSVKSQAVQALVGAVYHEQGLNAAKEFAKKNVFV